MGSFQPRLTPAVRGLLFTYIAVFVAQLSFTRFSSIQLEPIFGFVPTDFVHGSFWQFLTYPFLHGSLTHLFFNAVALYMFGTELEARWGTNKFLRYYAVCATGGAFLQMLAWGVALLVSPEWASFLGNTPVIGASGALYGLLMAFGVLYGDSMMLFMLIIPMKVRQAVVLFFFVEIFSFVFYSGPGFGGGVAHLVHLGGLITGFLYLRLMGGNLDGGGGGLFRKKKMSREEARRRLSLVVNNEDDKKNTKDGKYPVTWN